MFSLNGDINDYSNYVNDDYEDVLKNNNNNTSSVNSFVNIKSPPRTYENVDESELLLHNKSSKYNEEQNSDQQKGNFTSIQNGSQKVFEKKRVCCNLI
jgi:hypothetical protein